MKKLSPEERVGRISTSVPAELARWAKAEAVFSAQMSPYPVKASLSSLVAEALYDYQKKINKARNRIQKKTSDAADHHDGNPVNALGKKKK